VARKANPALIGAFLVGALVLAVIGLVVFGGGKVFTQKQTIVAYFEGSLNGMAVGAPVTFNGVKIGSVTDVKVVINTETNAIRTPVFFSIEAGRVREVSGAELKFEPGAPQLQALIDRGLRAQLQLQSLVTGQLEVALNFYPGTPMKLTGLTKEYPEVPTIPSTTEKLMATLENIPIDKLVAQVMHAVQSIDNLVASPEIKKTLRDLDRTVLHVDGLVGNADQTVTVGKGALVNIDRVINDAGKTIAVGQDAIVDVRGLLARGGPALEAALRDFDKLAKDAQRLAINADGMVNADSPIRYDLANVLKEIQAAARSLRVLTDYLDRHPEAVLSGKRADGTP
jgi:phospholipid/cholesterol/gamma-HCH transport system substrate-binding protein